MGSEGPSVVTVHVTGFKKFHGVSENPTEIIVRNLKGFMQKKGLPEGLVLGSCNVLETAGEGAVPQLYEVLQLAVAGQNKETSERRQIIWLHLGVNSGATRFAIENQAVNEATFRCPDEMGWKPQRAPVVTSDGSISRVRETSLPVSEIVKGLSKMGYDVMPSDDADGVCCFPLESTCFTALVLTFLKSGPRIEQLSCLDLLACYHDQYHACRELY
ncbi:uncharacterized protein LOC135587377 isoform X2 [Musa acuminata AAA Group]|uniref:uncharacterized protein LOC135587377 isoform X2 n=1 Tax=Musa acuminata AAA Group TaxID=214697 RepID=UPI0031D5199D